MNEHLTLHCQQCGKNFVQRSHRQGATERLLSLVYVYPFRCQVCGHRFKAFRPRVRYAKDLIDRRQYARLSTHVPTTFTELVTSGEYGIGRGVVRDLSLRGCHLQTVVELSEGTLLSLELQTVDNTPAIAVAASIVRSVGPTGVGLEFLRLDKPAQERLSQFVPQLLTEAARR